MSADPSNIQHDAIDNRVISKETVLKTWNPFAIIPAWKGGARADLPYAERLPGYEPCPVLSRVGGFTTMKNLHPTIQRFIEKLYKDDSLGSLAMLTTMELVLRNGGNLEPIENPAPLSGMFDDEHDASLLMEGWPLVQDYIDWKECLALYQSIHSKLHMVTLPHPLTKFAKDTLLNLPTEDFEEAVRSAREQKWFPESTDNRLRATQLFLDHVASLPSRRVGVLLDDPFVGDSATPLSQSCLPFATLELTGCQDGVITCSLISLYDSLDGSPIAVSTRPPSQNCSCALCEYGRCPQKFSQKKILPTKQEIEQATRLAHVLFQQEERYDEAKELYQFCYDSLPDESQSAKHKADLWHAMGAVELTRQEFVKAQEHWKNGKEYADIHSGIALQLEKQNAYGYFDPLPKSEKQCGLAFETISPRRLFVAPRVVPIEACQQLIEWAEAIGKNSATGGWTTSRHYAVPTNDIPLHQAPKILEWFQAWMNRDVQALLCEQFQTTQRFYVHDAFLVRYSASAKSRFLPLHFDECTHSLVLALNDDFEGGGTYFYNVNKTISDIPPGALISFRGNQLLHGGNVVSKGVRYIVAVFLYLDQDVCIESEVEKSSKRQKVFSGNDEGFSFGFF